MKAYFRECRGSLMVFGVCAILYLVTFGLYHLPLQAVIYPTVLCGILLLGYGGIRIWQRRGKHEELDRLRSLPDDLLEALAGYDKQDDRDYQAILRILREQEIRERQDYEQRLSDSMDYYTTWVHQIKTPIASMRLKLEGEDSPLSRGLAEDLFRIEQYVEMVLTYLRLDSSSTDYVFRECSLDDIVKGSLRKFAGQFIARGIRLEYRGLKEKAVTDEKWLSFVLEQILSNALKYTPQGSISVYMIRPLTLCIRDTGIGIAPEDLPRIFEKGYTGYNGRTDKRASGLGLYLSKRICDKLGVRITADSAAGQGTVISLHLEQKRQWHE